MDKLRKFNKMIAILLTIAFTVSIFPVKIFASQESDIELKVDENGNPTQETIDEIAETLEFIMEDVARFDEGGNLIAFDTDKFVARYGHSPEIDRMVEILEGDYSCTIVTRGAFADCIIQALKEEFGITVIEAILNGTLIDLLEKKKYKEAAELIAKGLLKVSGKVVGVATIAASLIVNAVSCGASSYDLGESSDPYFLSDLDQLEVQLKAY